MLTSDEDRLAQNIFDHRSWASYPIDHSRADLYYSIHKIPKILYCYKYISAKIQEYCDIG